MTWNKSHGCAQQKGRAVHTRRDSSPVMDLFSTLTPHKLSRPGPEISVSLKTDKQVIRARDHPCRCFFFYLQDQLVRLFEDCATNLCRWTTEAEGVSRKRCSTGSSSVTTLVRGSLIGWEAARMWRIWPGCIPALCLQTNLFVTNNHEILTLSRRLPRAPSLPLQNSTSPWYAVHSVQAWAIWTWVHYI